MNENDRIRKAYDEIPYDSFPYPFSHPDRMSVVGALRGLSAAPAANCRVLELGCASAGNLIPMAQSLPRSHFVGIDLSPKQIQQGHALIATLGLGNIELHAQSITEFSTAQPFDYIIAHGLYSWVPNEIRDKLLEICARHLTPCGLCFISCKTYPGWHMNNVLRDLMRFHTRNEPETAGQLHAAREVLEFAVSAFESPAPQSALVRQMAANLLKVPEMYLAHDHMSAINHPVMFGQFAAHAESHGLRYVGHADPLSDNLWRMPAAWQQQVAGWAGTPIEKEQYADFLCWRAIRANILCRSDAPLNDTVDPNAISSMHIAGRPQELTGGDPRSPVKFSTGDRFITTGDAAVIHAIRRLKEFWPNSLPFAQLIGMIPADQRGDPATLHRRLVDDLLTCHRLRLVELWTRPVDFLSRSSTHPRVPNLVRWQAGRSSVLTTLRHEMFNATDPGRRLIALLDGTRDIPTLHRLMSPGVAPADIDHLLQTFADESLLMA